MRKNTITGIGAVFTAFLSTLCCLPAFIFIFFGISSSFLSYITTLGYLRVPMAILSIIFFILAIKKFRNNISCYKTKKQKIVSYIVFIVIFIFYIFLLLYPELLAYILE